MAPFSSHVGQGFSFCPISTDPLVGTPLHVWMVDRADWGPAAPSGKCTAGVPRVFWRCPAGLQGPSTHNSTCVYGETRTSKNWPISPVCMWKCGESAPCGQTRLWRPSRPECAKTPCRLAVPLIKDKKNCELSPKNQGQLLQISRWWPYFVAGILLDGSGLTRKAESNLGLRETPYF